MRRSSSMKNLSNVVASSLDRLGLGTKLREQLVIIKWSEVVGEKIAAVSIPERICEGVLWVACKSSVWANELMLHREHIKTQLNGKVGKRVVREIRFSSRGYRKLLANQVVDNKKQDIDIEGIVLSCEQQEKADSVASTVDDSELSEVIRKAVVVSLKRAQAKQEDSNT